MPPSIIYGIAKRFNEFGSVSKKEYPKDCKANKPTTSAELVILNEGSATHSPDSRFLPKIQDLS